MNMQEPEVQLLGEVELLSAPRAAWPRVRFGDVVRLNTDRAADPLAAGIERFVGLEHIEPENLRIRRWGFVAEGTTFTNLFRPGQVLFGKRRAYQRKVALADFEGVCSSDIYVFETKDPDVLLPALLPFLCQTDGFFQHAVGTSAGSLSPRTNWTQLAAYGFALPPLEEQRRIAEVLIAIGKVHDSLLEAAQSIRQLMASRIEDFLKRFDGESYEFPVGELLKEPPRNGFSPTTNDLGQGLRTVSISAISDGVFTPEGNIKYAEVDLARIRPFLVDKNDVFVVRGNGNRRLTGKCAMSSESYTGLFYPDLLIRLRFDQTRIDPRFAVLEWNSPRMHSELVSRAKSTNGIWKINGQDIRKHILAVPPKHDQIDFMTEVDTLTETLAMLRDRARNVTSMKGLVLNTDLLGKPQ
jgi:type I restriction enzyme S subunit